MTGHISNYMRLHAQQALAGIGISRIGIVTSYDPNAYAVKVETQPDGFMTGWLPLLSPWIGDGWGMFCAPSIGDPVEVAYEGGDVQSGYACLRFFSDIARPVPTLSGEILIRHKSGALFALRNNGSAIFSDGNGASISLNGDGTITSQASQWAHSGPISVDGDITSTGTITASVDVIAGGKSGAHHTHADPQGGSVGEPE